ncbi:transcriptional regulator [Luteimicrobium album]|uniref:Transcriptional regulator n=1 Tax=Luteimicrobium album TaxID=1054550 RepID=A0ABQ6I999_9MICO|nr:WYL domain-containing protein [Luteimicrobium album]GMA26543.1 transcriptional regulator [Luteimicrobium album]
MVVMGSGTGARMLALLDLLESGGLRGRTELARLLGVDERTVRRDVVRLLDAGVPVESVRGRYGGYRLGRGYRLPPLMLTDDEAVAVLVALADASDRTGDVPAATAAAKVRRVLPAASAARLEGLVEAAVVPGDVTAVDADVLLTVAGAVREHRPIEIAHRRRGDPAGEPAARRVVHPYGLVRRDGRWYLLGLALDRGAERTFRLDRVERARTLAGRFRPPPGYDPVVRLEALQGTGYRYAVRVRVRATEAEVRRFLPASVARVRPAGPPADGAWLSVELGADRLDWLPGVLAALDRPFVVDEPDELVTRLRELADRLAARVNAASPDVGS